METIEIETFKKLYKNFMNTANFINKEMDELDKDPDKKERYLFNFFKNYEKPMEDAWAKLSPDEKARFSSIYKHDKKIVNQVLDG